MDKAGLKAALERELAFYNQNGDQNKARQVREQLAELEPKPKAPPATERAVVEPKAEHAVVEPRVNRRG